MSVLYKETKESQQNSYCLRIKYNWSSSFDIYNYKYLAKRINWEAFEILTTQNALQIISSPFPIGLFLLKINLAILEITCLPLLSCFLNYFTEQFESNVILSICFLMQRSSSVRNLLHDTSGLYNPFRALVFRMSFLFPSRSIDRVRQFWNLNSGTLSTESAQRFQDLPVGLGPSDLL